MRIIFLNCWNSRTGKVFLDFVEGYSLNIDIFCFQEVFPKLFEKISNLLPDHTGYYLTENKMIDLGFVTGQATFVNKNIKVISSGKIGLYRQVYNSIQEHSAVYCGDELNADMSSSSGGKPRSLEREGCHNDVWYMQYADIEISNKVVHLANIHGKARPGHKLDTPTRLRQSKVIINFFKDKHGPKIIGGDFNLLPETKSVQMFEEAGYKNLIKDYKIKTTRNMLAWGTLKKSEEKQCFADYVFTSSDVKVKSFEVPDIKISDHLPLILSFEI